jgi:hypothetical protein
MLYDEASLKRTLVRQVGLVMGWVGLIALVVGSYSVCYFAGGCGP